MSYATTDDLDARALPPDVRSTATATDKQLALDSASAVVDSYLKQAGYTTPIAAPGDDVIEVEVSIAAWRVAVSVNLAPEQGDRSNLYLRNRDAMKWLSEVAAGRVRPFGAVVDTTEGADDYAPIVGGRKRRGW
jgi:phage gp36-like protein